MNSIQLTSNSLNDTLKIGERLGANLKGGEVIELLSDLGGGKTSLVKGLSTGAGSNELVSSPSFTICNEYQSKNFKIYHFDFYRLNDPGIIRRELREVMENPENVTVIEWPDTVEDSLPKNRLVITITAISQDKRRIKLTLPNNLNFLTKGLK